MEKTWALGSCGQSVGSNSGPSEAGGLEDVQRLGLNRYCNKKSHIESCVKMCEVSFERAGLVGWQSISCQSDVASGRPASPLQVHWCKYWDSTSTC